MSLEELRERRAWSQADLARAAGVSVTTVTAVEAGTTRPQRGTLRRLAAALELEAAELAPYLTGRGAALAERLRQSAGTRGCEIPDCPDPHLARGWCLRHYARWRKYGDPLAWARAVAKPKSPSKRRTPEQRFWARVSKQEGGCWRWTGGVDRHGSGRFCRVDKREEKAHRVAYSLAHGPLVPEQVLANRCGTHACVNPEHWDVSSREDIGRRNFGWKGKRDAG